MKERMDKKTPLLQSGVIAAGANWNPRYHPVFITHEARGYEKKSYKKRPYFLSEIGATCAVPPYIILCAYIRNVDRRLGLLRSTKGLTGDSQYWNAPACTIRRLSVPWTNIFLVPFTSETPGWACILLRTDLHQPSALWNLLHDTYPDPCHSFFRVMVDIILPWWKKSIGFLK